MADPSPNQSRPGTDPGGRSGPLSSRASVPPSEPRSRASGGALDAQIDRPARLQMIVALILGLVLVAIPLYLWRRPRAESITVAALGAEAGVLPAVTAAPGVLEDKLALEPARVLSCSDPGSRRTSAEQCDHLVELEKAFATAIEASSGCVPREAGGGTIVYVADVVFKRKQVTLSVPKDGRTLKSSSVASACEKAVKARLQGVSLDTMKHRHSRYRIAITATYPGSVRP
jgi:hypothetical protein